MSDDLQPSVGADPTLTPEVTAPSDSVQQPEVEQSQQPVEEKKFSQADVDAMIGKRLAREQRKWEREQQTRVVEQPAQTQQPLHPDQFQTTEAYAEALAERRAQELIAQRENERQQAQVLETYHDKEDEARGKYADFDQVAYNPNLRITPQMAEAIRLSDVGPEVAYHLGMNPQEAARISRLSPIAQAKEIGKLEVEVTKAPPVKKTTSAPEPIRPVASRSTPTPVLDTTDPRSTSSMSTSDWIAAERKRQIAKLQARNR